jgi:hypothetical protein
MIYSEELIDLFGLKKHKLKVEREDIMLGQREEAEFCAVAQAVKRQVIKPLKNSDAYRPSVQSGNGVFLGRHGKAKYQLLFNEQDTKKLEQFIHEFDLIDDNDELLKSEIEPIELTFILTEVTPL